MYLALGLVVLLIIGGFIWWSQVPQSDTAAQKAVEITALAPEVEAVLSQKTSLLVDLMKDPGIIAAVRSSNEKNASLTQADITRLDQEWQDATDASPFITNLLTNATSQRLIAFQNLYPEFKEVFVADARGLNVGQTDKTSDYYQADESWWVDSYNKGRGKSLHGAIEFDESSQTEAISIYVPVMDGARAIGVVKGVLNLSAISAEL